LGGGKRLRPVLALATAKTFGEDTEIGLSAACTLEMVHTYSMIHDDLPCMDDDDYRRGKLTVHKKFNEGHAILTGDYLLTYAFEVLANDSLLSLDKKVKLIRTLAHCIGGDGMVGGQVMDLAFEKKKISLDTLRLLHQKKTGALLTAAVEFGGIIANVTEQQMNPLRQFGENIGLAFQIVDDILDVTASHTKHGRETASDFMNEKSTYVTLLGVEQAQVYAQEYYQKAIQALKALPINSSLLIYLADYVLKRSH
jgi:geranylgeranyl pyrophosphate synthase